MSNRSCKGAICCSAVAAKISMIDRLILNRFIEDDETLDLIIDMGEKIDKKLTKFIEDQFRDD